MRFQRRIILILIALGLPMLPACLMPEALRNKLQARTQPSSVGTTVEAAPAKISEFKALGPGQRLSHTDPDVVKVPKNDTKSDINSDAKGDAKNVPMTPEMVEPSGTTPPTSPTDPAPLQAASLFEPKNKGPRPDGPLVAAVRAHLDNQYASAVQHLAGFDRSNQELFLLLLPILDSARTVDLTGRDPKSASALVKQLSSATELVARSAPLEILSMSLVYKVVKYGVYDPLPANYQFLPGGIASMYAEIDHAPSVPAIQSNGEKSYVTRLNCSIQLIDSSGQVVDLYDKDSDKWVPTYNLFQHNFTRSPVRDFFLNVKFSVPEKPGNYTLTLDVRDPDPDHPRRVRKSIEFQVRGK
jgi:hypothetical protein